MIHQYRNKKVKGKVREWENGFNVVYGGNPAFAKATAVGVGAVGAMGEMRKMGER